MKKIILAFAAFLFLFSNNAFAGNFDSLEGITAEQLDKLSEIQQQFKQENNSIEQKLMEYSAKIAKVQKEVDKSAADIAILSAAYERNIKTLKAQQLKLETTELEAIKAVLTDEQYNQYLTQRDKTLDAFYNFLQK